MAQVTGEGDHPPGRRLRRREGTPLDRSRGRRPTLLTSSAEVAQTLSGASKPMIAIAGQPHSRLGANLRPNRVTGAMFRTPATSNNHRANVLVSTFNKGHYHTYNGCASSPPVICLRGGSTRTSEKDQRSISIGLCWRKLDS